MMDERHFPIEAIGDEVVSIGQCGPQLFYYRGEQFEDEQSFLDHVRDYNENTIKISMNKYILITLIALFITSCEESCPLNKDKVRERNGHIYLWRVQEGYVHDPKCPGCNGA